MEKIIAVLIVGLHVVTCQNEKLGDQGDERFYKKSTRIVDYDFSKMPLKRDIVTMHGDSLNKFEVKNGVLDSTIRRQMNYTKLFYYTNLQSQPFQLFTVLGYYDLYVDLWLVTMKGDSVLSTIIIASLSGDEAYTEEITAFLKNSKPEFEKIYMKEQRFFTKPDTVKVLEGHKSRITISPDGRIVEDIKYHLAKDSIIER